MERSYWQRQRDTTPLFPELLWSRPENKNTAGKLLIVGGNAHGFAAPAEAYQESIKAGIGTAKVLLPDALQKTVGKYFEAGEFAPSTPSGSFSQKALGELLSFSAWADGVLLAGDMGRNSETAIVLEAFATKYPGLLTITRDALDYFYNTPQAILERPDTTLVLSLAQLQKLAIAAQCTKPVTFSMDLMRLADMLHAFTQTYAAHIIVKHLEHICVASHGKVSTTHLAKDTEIWRVPTAARASVWWLQNPAKPFEALSTSLC